MVFRQMNIRNPLNLFKTNPTHDVKRNPGEPFLFLLSCPLAPLDLGKLRLKFSGHHPFLSGYTVISFWTSTEFPHHLLAPRSWWYWCDGRCVCSLAHEWHIGHPLGLKQRQRRKVTALQLRTDISLPGKVAYQTLADISKCLIIFCINKWPLSLV